MKIKLYPGEYLIIEFEGKKYEIVTQKDGLCLQSFHDIDDDRV